MSSNFLPPQNNQNNPQGQPKRRTGLLSGYSDSQTSQSGLSGPPSLAGNAAPPPSPAPPSSQRPLTGNLSGQLGPQGQQPPRGPYPPQGPMSTPGMMPSQGMMPPQGPMSTQGMMPPQGMMPSQGQRPPQGMMPPQGPMSTQGMMPPQGQRPPQRQLPPPQQTQQWNGPAFMAGPMQMVQRWSQKMSAMRQPGPPVDPNPLVRYKSPQMPMPMPVSQPEKVQLTQRPWRLSRTQRINHMIRKRRGRWQSSKPNGKRVGIIVTSVFAALLIITLVSSGISSYAYYQSQLPQLQGLASLSTVHQSTRVYDRNGALLATFYDNKYGRSTPVTYAEIPGFLQDAQIAAEDKNFWTDNGVDPVAIVRSAFKDASSQSAQTGASTITQQVVKNLDGNTETTLQRKASEAALAIGLTQEYPKWKILEMYFNIAPYGTQELGADAAAEDFFGLKAICDANFKCTPALSFLDRDLSKCTKPGDETTCAIDPILGLARATLLAGIPQSPPAFDPTTNYANYDSLLLRQDYVLNQMMTDGMGINLGLGSQTDKKLYPDITPDIIKQVETLSKNMQFVGFNNNEKAPHFVTWIIQTLATEMGNGDYGVGLETLEDSGLNIQTTLDLNLETYVENAIKRHITQPEYQPFQNVTETLSKSDNLHDSAAVVLDAKTGEILAMDGSVNFNDQTDPGGGQNNMAVSPRAPGSSFKPIVLAAAYEQGFYPGIVLPDFETFFPQGESQSLAAKTSTYDPTDYGSTFNKVNSNIEFAISNSYNVPAIKMEYYVGLNSVYNMAARLGITSINNIAGSVTGLNPSMALGTDPVSLLQMAGAYQVFADKGLRVAPQGIMSIWDNYGDHLYTYNSSNVGTQVLSPQISYLVTSTLTNVADRTAEFGNDHVLDMTDWTLSDGTHPEVAAKTGTTDSFRDNWTIGYTPDVVVGVWSGNANDAAMENSIGVTGAAPIWHSIIEYVSGRCNKATDDISCPPLDLKNYTDRAFTIPDGVVQQTVSNTNGLAGGGYATYMIDGEQPMQNGDVCTSTNTTGTPIAGGNGVTSCTGTDPTQNPTPDPNATATPAPTTTP